MTARRLDHTHTPLHGVVRAGWSDPLDASYSRRATEREATRAAAAEWHASGAEGVCARSASLARRGVDDWRGDHRRFGELAIFVTNARDKPTLRRRRADAGWLRAEPGGG